MGADLSFRLSAARGGIHCILEGIPACAGMTWGVRGNDCPVSFRPSPARAGIHCIMEWIPACAGMTWGVRGNDCPVSFRPSVARAGIHCIMEGIPACAGMTWKGGRDSRLRGNDCGACAGINFGFKFLAPVSIKVLLETALC
ncbi:hypothetical protein Calab_3758 [Caldithrix abyssi DSM 13497]|uniref:Uncharacterized protein n=1 Tax=Caldithrix abyssi DSM 13497 TaxID=880073 RepID=H1XPI4_CALAY|nr:hypothetical protein Calab_3758 [Caldithrix abyssi DSM 13497]